MSDGKLTVTDVVERYGDRINSVSMPNYSEELKKLSKLTIEIPGNEVDPDVIISLLDDCMRFRNVLLRKKVIWGRKATQLKRYADSLHSILKGMFSGTAQEKEGKATQVLEEYMDKVEEAEQSYYAVRDFLDNIDQAALQLSRMLKVLDQPFTRVVLSERGGDNDKLAVLRRWGATKDSNAGENQDD